MVRVGRDLKAHAVGRDSPVIPGGSKPLQTGSRNPFRVPFRVSFRILFRVPFRISL